MGKLRLGWGGGGREQGADADAGSAFLIHPANLFQMIELIYYIVIVLVPFPCNTHFPQ